MAVERPAEGFQGLDGFQGFEGGRAKRCFLNREKQNVACIPATLMALERPVEGFEGFEGFESGRA